MSRPTMPSSIDTLASVASSAEPNYLWDEIVRWTFEVCIQRKEGRASGVAELLQVKLPALIRAWSARCGLPAEKCKERLRALFVRAQEDVELGQINRRLIVEEVVSRLGGSIGGRGHVPTQSGLRPAPTFVATSRGQAPYLRRRVPIDDVPGMLDALAEAEFETFGESILPLRKAVPTPHTLLAGETDDQLAVSV